MMDASGLSVVDAHCHPFRKEAELSADSFTDLLSFAYSGDGGTTPTTRSLRQNVVYFRWLVRQMAAFFDCEPELESVVETRNRLARDYQSYLARLYGDCGLTALVVDFGYPQPPIDRLEFGMDMPVAVVPITQIEPLIERLIGEEVGWTELCRRYDEALARAIESDGYRGLKSTIAYETGLDISPLSRSQQQGQVAFDAFKRPIGGQTLKPLRDHLFCRALEICMEYDIPMQIHVGIGSLGICATRCNPILLFDLLKLPAYQSARVVLIHGYPFMAEAGFMASMLPGVYCDVSEGIPFAAHAADRIYLTLLEMAPFSKIMYGSDGLGVPELIYLGAKLGKSALARALDRLVERGFLSSREGEEVAGSILADNARALYRIEQKA